MVATPQRDRQAPVAAAATAMPLGDAIFHGNHSAAVHQGLLQAAAAAMCDTTTQDTQPASMRQVPAHLPGADFGIASTLTETIAGVEALTSSSLGLTSTGAVACIQDEELTTFMKKKNCCRKTKWMILIRPILLLKQSLHDGVDNFDDEEAGQQLRKRQIDTDPANTIAVRDRSGHGQVSDIPFGGEEDVLNGDDDEADQCCILL